MGELRPFAELSPDQVIRAVLDHSGYRAMLKNSTDEEDVDRLANIEELITLARANTRRKTPRRTIWGLSRKDHAGQRRR